PVDNEALLCSHKKLNMNSSFKCISTESADFIYSRYNGGPRILLPAQFCHDCVSHKIKLATTKNDIDSDSKIITNLLKFKNSGDERMLWVGKESFRKWRHIKMSLIEKEPDLGNA